MSRPRSEIKNFVQSGEFSKKDEVGKRTDISPPSPINYKQFFTPYPPNPQFFGRAAALQLLSDWLNPFTTTSTHEEPRTAILWGMGGIGKTQLALQYAYTHRDRYCAVFWLRGETMADLAKSCREIVQKLRLTVERPDSEIPLFNRWLAGIDLPYLLIVDNVEDDEVLSSIWPSQLDNGSIIVTSQRTEIRDYGFTLSMEVHPFSIEEGSKFLLGILRATNAGSEKDELEASLSISQQLGGLPLAIAQAAGFMNSNAMTITELLNAYQAKKHTTKFNKSNSIPNTYQHSLESVWLLSFKALSTESYRLLGIMSHLDPDSIPASLLHQDPLTTFRFHEAIRDLIRRSLIKHTEESGNSTFLVHRVLQNEFRGHLSREERSNAFEQCTQLVLDAIQSKSFGDTTQSQETYELLLPHITHLKNLPESLNSKTFAALSSHIAELEVPLFHDHQSVLSDDTNAPDLTHSDDESGSSRSSVIDEETKSATSLLVELFRQDSMLVESASRLLHTVGEDRFHRDFTHLLILFSKDLLTESSSNSRLQAAGWIEARSRLISKSFRASITLSSDVLLNQLPPRPENDHAILEQYLENVEPPTKVSSFLSDLSHASYDTTPYCPDDHMEGDLYLQHDQSAEDDNDVDFEARIEHIQTFVAKSSALEKLNRNLEMINKSHKCDVDGYDRTEGVSTAIELKEHRSTRHGTAFAAKELPKGLQDLWSDGRNPTIWYTFWASVVLGGISILLGVLQVLIGAAQLSIAIDHWNLLADSKMTRIGDVVAYWRSKFSFAYFWIFPLGFILCLIASNGIHGREKPCPANMVRGRWQCACGEVVVDDFYEIVSGSVNIAMSELGEIQSTHSFSTKLLSALSPRKIFSSLGDRVDLLTDWLSKTIINLRKAGRSDKSNREESGDIQRLNELPIANVPPPRYLLLCISLWRGYYLTQMLPVDLNVSNDEILFCQLKASYHRQVGWWKRMLSLRFVKDVRFVRFRITRSKLVDINLHSRMEGRIREALPPADHYEYSYDPKPIQFEPPVGHNTMIHLYRCPKSSGNFCLKRFPGYCQEQVRMDENADETLAWGIELVEGRDWVYLWVIGFLISCSGITFGVVWSVLQGDVSGTFQVALEAL